MIKNLPLKTDAILISNPANLVHFSQDFGFSYSEREAFLFITKNRNYLITDKRYSEAVRKAYTDFELIDVGVSKFLETTIHELFIKENIKTLGIEENNISVAEFKKLNHKIKIENINLQAYRIIKNSKEISKIKTACKITDKAFIYIQKQLKVGITETEISLKLENFIKSNKADISFRPIIAFAKNSAVPHHLSNNTKLKNDNIVLIDFGVKFKNYCSDMTRTIFFGKPDSKFIERYNIVLESQSKAIDYINNQLQKNDAKLIAKEIDKIARDYITSNNYSSIPHSVGHGIGLEVHETPNISPGSDQLIKKGMVFSIEPGIYIENWGGIRIEDLIYINNKAELLYSTNREIIKV